MEEIKQQPTVRSFRVTDEVMSKFKEIQDEMKLTQDAALKMLVGAYEMEKAKNAIPDRETEIANFQAKTNELVEAFLHSLQLNQDAEARARSEVAIQMKSKDETIIDLQEKNETLKAKFEELTAEVKETKEKFAEAVKSAQSAQKESERAEASLATSNALVSAKNAEIERLTAEAEFASGAKKMIETLQTNLSEQKKRAEVAERAIEDLCKDHEKEIDFVKREAALAAREDALIQLSEKFSAKDEEIARLKIEIMQLKLVAQDN